MFRWIREIHQILFEVQSLRGEVKCLKITRDEVVRLVAIVRSALAAEAMAEGERDAIKAQYDALAADAGWLDDDVLNAEVEALIAEASDATPSPDTPA